MRDGKPLVIDGFCGLGGWTEGFLAEGYHCIGLDIERHDYGTGGYPGELILRDILTVNGAEFADADCFVFSPPCQEYSYMAMPWSRAKQIAAALRSVAKEYPMPFPDGYTGSRTIADLNRLFDACFRIQREASAAAGRHIPMVIENVRGAQAWVGDAPANYGSFYVWGDVGMVGHRVVCVRDGVPVGYGVAPTGKAKLKTTGRVTELQAADHNCHINEMRDALKVPGFRFDGSGQKVGEYSDPRRNRGRGCQMTSPQENGLKVQGIKLTEVGFNVAAAQRYREQAKQRLEEGVKGGGDWFGSGEDCSLQRRFSGTKQAGISGKRENGKGDKWFQDGAAAPGSRSNSRKAASAMIAKIPFALAQYVAQSFKPNTDVVISVGGEGEGKSSNRAVPPSQEAVR